ncbi:hypothetical protein I4U23_012467 [Adineta vaga]|nr:hypothetical protein I4U23_012467 [Adineta vaga]
MEQTVRFSLFQLQTATPTSTQTSSPQSNTIFARIGKRKLIYDGGDQQLLKTSSEWPTRGSIHFQNYSLRHRSGLKTVLNNLNLYIESNEKIGIIGRTGAVEQNLVIFDPILVIIIPQQPILFTGTLRYNLDPFKFYFDDQYWMALDDVQLKEFVSQNPSGLEMLIEEAGCNLSVGQCQLICIARVILKKSKILLIDETTSNVDQKTDEIVQEIIGKKFQNRTVLTIAHRLNTIAKSDRIVVLDKSMIINVDVLMKIFEQYQQASKR